MLRASVEMKGGELDLRALTDEKASETSGIAHGDVLIAFAEAVVARNGEEMARTRAAVADAVGRDGLVDTSGIIANFQRMVRIADSTGIPLDTPVEMLSADVRGELGVDRFASAANTPSAGSLQRTFGAVLRPLMLGGLRLAGRFRNR